MKRCPICGKEYEQGSKCPSCGMVLIDTESDQAVNVAQEQREERNRQKEKQKQQREEDRKKRETERKKKSDERMQRAEEREESGGRQLNLDPKILIIAAVCVVVVIVLLLFVIKGKKSNSVQQNTDTYEQTQMTDEAQDETGEIADDTAEIEDDTEGEEVTLNEKDFAQTDYVKWYSYDFEFSLPEYWGNLCEYTSDEHSITFYQARSTAAGYSGELFAVARVSKSDLSEYSNYTILATGNIYTWILCYPSSVTYDSTDEYTILEYERLLEDVSIIQGTFTYTESDSDYIIADSSSRYLTESDLESLSAEELKYARNEIYARYGRKFKDETIQAYFDSKDWYTGTIEPDDFSQSMLNEYEKYNTNFILSYEKEKGYN